MLNKLKSNFIEIKFKCICFCVVLLFFVCSPFKSHFIGYCLLKNKFHWWMNKWNFFSYGRCFFFGAAHVFDSKLRLLHLIIGMDGVRFAFELQFYYNVFKYCHFERQTKETNTIVYGSNSNDKRTEKKSYSNTQTYTHATVNMNIYKKNHSHTKRWLSDIRNYTMVCRFDSDAVIGIPSMLVLCMHDTNNNNNFRVNEVKLFSVCGFS